MLIAKALKSLIANNKYIILRYIASIIRALFKSMLKCISFCISFLVTLRQNLQRAQVFMLIVNSLAIYETICWLLEKSQPSFACLIQRAVLYITTTIKQFQNNLVSLIISHSWLYAKPACIQKFTTLPISKIFMFFIQYFIKYPYQVLFPSSLYSSGNQDKQMQK